MTPTLENHEQRITVLEERVDEQARLRAGQDRDLADIAENVRAQGRLIQALAVTQSEHTQALAQLQNGMGRLENGMQQIVGKLDLLIERDGGR